MSSNEQARMMLNALPAAVALLRPISRETQSFGEYRYIDANDAFLSLQNAPLEQLLEWNVGDGPLGEKDGDALLALLRGVQSGGQSQDAVFWSAAAGQAMHAKATLIQPGMLMLMLCDASSQWLAQERGQALEQENFRLTMLNTLIGNLNVHQSLSQIVKTVVDALFAQYPDHHIGVGVLDTAHVLQVDYARSAVPQMDQAPISFHCREAIRFRERIAQMRLFCSEDADYDDLLQGIRLPSGSQVRLQSTLMMPIRHPDAIAGVLMMSAYREHPWQPAQKKLFEEVAALLELALNRASERRQRRDMEMELLAGRERLALVFENNGDGVWDWDARQNIIRYTVYDPRSNTTFSQDLTLDTWLEDIHLDDRQRVLDTLMAHYDGRTPAWDQEYRMVDEETREYVWVQSRGRIVSRDPNGVPLRAVGTTANIDQRKRAEEAKQAYERERDRILAVMDSSSDIIGIVDLGGRTIYSNPASRRMLGYQDDTQLSLTDVCSAEGVNLLLSEATRYALRYGNWQGENTIVHRDGTRIPVAQSVFPVRSSDGELLGYGTIIKDITAQKKLENQLRESRDRLDNIVRCSNTVISHIDRNGIYQYNEGRPLAQRKSAHGERLGRHFTEVFFDNPAFADHIDKALRGEITSRELHIGERIYLASYSPYVEADGTRNGIIAISADVTELKSVQEQLQLSGERLNAVIEGADILLTQFARDGRIVLAAGQALAKRHIEAGTLIGKTAYEVFANRPRILEDAADILAGKVSRYELTLHGVEYETVFSPYTDADGAFAGIIAVSYEVSERNRLLKALMTEKERLRITLQSIGDAVIATDCQGNITMMNRAAQELCDQSFEQAQSRGLAEVMCLHDVLYAGVKIDPVQQVLADTQAVCGDRLLQLHRQDGSIRVVSCIASPIRDANGGTDGVVTVFRDVTEATHKEAEIRFLSYHDALTGLYNRAYFEEQVQRLDAEMPRVSVIMGDVNGLKLTNDVFGHTQGDLLLKEIADILGSCCRPQDIIARWGGDEYAVLLPDAPGSVVQDVCLKIYQTCQRRSEGRNGNSCPSISLGFATRDAAGDTIATLLKVAEDAMYKRKLLESKSLHSSIIASIRTTLLEKSHETEEHAARLIDLTRAMGHALGFQSDRLDDLELFSLLHDIGKIGISDQILNKKGPLDDLEWQEIRKHPEIGFRIAQASPEIVHIADYILCHHEHWDGNGYPQGLVGRAIPLAARILAIADAFDAMTSNRSYRKALGVDQAVGELRRCAGTQFDPELVEIFLSDKVRSALLRA